MYSYYTDVAFSDYGTQLNSTRSTNGGFSVSSALVDSVGNTTGQYLHYKESYTQQEFSSVNVNGSRVSSYQSDYQTAWSLYATDGGGLLLQNAAIYQSVYVVGLTSSSLFISKNDGGTTTFSESGTFVYSDPTYNTGTASQATTGSSEATTSYTRQGTSYVSTLTSTSTTTTTQSFSDTYTTTSGGTGSYNVTSYSYNSSTLNRTRIPVLVVKPEPSEYLCSITATATHTAGEPSVVGSLQQTNAFTVFPQGRSNTPAGSVAPATFTLTDTYFVSTVSTLVTLSQVSASETLARFCSFFPNTLTATEAVWLLSTGTTAFVGTGTSTSTRTATGGTTATVSVGGYTWLSASAPVTINTGTGGTAAATFAMVYSTTTSIASIYFPVTGLSNTNSTTENIATLATTAGNSATSSYTSITGASTSASTTLTTYSLVTTSTGTDPCNYTVASTETNSSSYIATNGTYLYFNSTFHAPSSVIGGGTTYSLVGSTSYTDNCGFASSVTATASSVEYIGASTFFTYASTLHTPAHTHTVVSETWVSITAPGTTVAQHTNSTETWFSSTLATTIGGTVQGTVTLTSTHWTITATTTGLSYQNIRSESTYQGGLLFYEVAQQPEDYRKTATRYALRYPNVTVLQRVLEHGFLTAGVLYTNLSCAQSFYYPFVANGRRYSQTVINAGQETSSVMSHSDRYELMLYTADTAYTTGSTYYTARYDTSDSLLHLTRATESTYTSSTSTLTSLDTTSFNASVVGTVAAPQYEVRVLGWSASSHVDWNPGMSSTRSISDFVPWKGAGDSSSTTYGEFHSPLSYNGRAFSVAGGHPGHALTVYLGPGVYAFTRQSDSTTAAFTTSYAAPTWITSATTFGLAIPDRQESIVEPFRSGGTYLQTTSYSVLSIAEASNYDAFYATLLSSYAGGHGTNNRTSDSSLRSRPIFTLSRYPVFDEGL